MSSLTFVIDILAVNSFKWLAAVMHKCGSNTNMGKSHSFN